MATIKVPYTYIQYPFSEKATRYSKRMAKKKYETGIVTGMISFFLITALVYSLPFVKGNDGMAIVVLAVALGGAVFCGIRAERYRNQWFKKKIMEALEEDLNRMLPGQSELVKAQLCKLEAEIK